MGLNQLNTKYDLFMKIKFLFLWVSIIYLKSYPIFRLFHNSHYINVLHMYTSTNAFFITKIVLFFCLYNSLYFTYQFIVYKCFKEFFLRILHFFFFIKILALVIRLVCFWKSMSQLIRSLLWTTFSVHNTDDPLKIIYTNIISIFRMIYSYKIKIKRIF